MSKNLGVILSSLALLPRLTLVGHLPNKSPLWLPIGPSRHRRSPGLLHEPLTGLHGSTLSPLSQGLFLFFNTQNNPTKTLGQTKPLLCLSPSEPSHFFQSEGLSPVRPLPARPPVPLLLIPLPPRPHCTAVHAPSFPLADPTLVSFSRCLQGEATLMPHVRAMDTHHWCRAVEKTGFKEGFGGWCRYTSRDVDRVYTIPHTPLVPGSGWAQMVCTHLGQSPSSLPGSGLSI